MVYKKFNSFEEFFSYFNLSKNCSIRLTSEECAYFEFKPYKNDDVVIRGWIKEFNCEEVNVSFKYREFNLGSTIWNIDTAKKFIPYVDYWCEEN